MSYWGNEVIPDLEATLNPKELRIGTEDKEYWKGYQDGAKDMLAKVFEMLIPEFGLSVVEDKDDSDGWTTIEN